MTTSPKLLLPVLPESVGLAISKKYPVASCLYHLPGISKLKTLLRKKCRRGQRIQSPDSHHGELSSCELPRLQTSSLAAPSNLQPLILENHHKPPNLVKYMDDLHEFSTIVEAQSPDIHPGEFSNDELSSYEGSLPKDCSPSPRVPLILDNCPTMACNSRTSLLEKCLSFGAQPVVDLYECQNPLIQKIPPETSSSPLFLPEKCRKLPYSDNAEKSLCKASIISAVQPPAFHPDWRTVQQLLQTVFDPGGDDDPETPLIQRIPCVPNLHLLLPENCRKLSTISTAQPPAFHPSWRTVQQPRLQTVFDPGGNVDLEEYSNLMIQKIPCEPSSSPLFLPENCRKLYDSDNHKGGSQESSTISDGDENVCLYEVSSISVAQSPAFHPDWRIVQQLKQNFTLENSPGAHHVFDPGKCPNLIPIIRRISTDH